MEKAETLLASAATLLQELLVDKRQNARPGRTLGLPVSEIRTCAGQCAACRGPPRCRMRVRKREDLRS